MNTVENKSEYQLSPKNISLINFLKKEIIWKSNLERNNIYLEEKSDFKKIKNNLSEFLEKLWINNYKIDDLSFLMNNVIVITILDEDNKNNREYIKIFYKWDLKKEIKDYINNILNLWWKK